MSAPTTSRPASAPATSKGHTSGGTELPEGQHGTGAHDMLALGANASRPAISRPATKGRPTGGTESPEGHAFRDTHHSPALGPDTPPARRPTRIQGGFADGGKTPGSQRMPDTQVPCAAGVDDRGGHGNLATQIMNAASVGEQDRTAIQRPAPMRGSLLDPALALAADVLDDIERVRIANENRLRQLTRSVEDSDGELRGFGLDQSHPDVARLAALVTTLAKVEHDATLNLQRVIRRHPLYSWVKAQRGVGEKQAARLLAAIGDPYWNTLADRPRRGPAELWAYCGYIPGQKRQRGQKSNWSTAAKMRAFNIAESMLKAGNREVYDKRKAATEDRVHGEPCVRCGPSGKPAPAGSPWSAAHRHADALRVTAKALLKDLWRAAKHIHEQGSGQSSAEIQVSRAAAPYQPGDA